MENLIWDFNRASGLHALPQAEAVQRQMNQFAEESDEFWKAWAKGDKLKMLDGLADMIFVMESLQDLESHLPPLSLKLGGLSESINGCVYVSGFDDEVVGEAYERVCYSNLTKFDDNEDDAIKTHHKHIAHNRPVETVKVGDYWVCRLTEDVEGFGHKGKILKSHKFKTVNLEDLV